MAEKFTPGTRVASPLRQRCYTDQEGVETYVAASPDHARELHEAHNGATCEEMGCHGDGGCTFTLVEKDITLRVGTVRDGALGHLLDAGGLTIPHSAEVFVTASADVWAANNRPGMLCSTEA